MNRWKRHVLVAVLMVAAGVSLLGVHSAAAQDLDLARLFGTPFIEHAMAVTTDRDGNVYLVGATAGKFPGQTRGGGDLDAYVSKFDAAGNDVWTRQFGTIGDDWARAVAIDPEGNIVVAGEAAENIPGRMRVSGIGGAYVRKFGPDGNELWMRHFGVRQFSRANGVAVDQDGNIFLAGQIEGTLPGQSAAGFNDAFLRAYDKNGQELWTRQFGTEAGDFAAAVTVDSDGQVFVVGSVGAGTNLPGGPIRQSITPFIRKFDGAGSLLWAQQIQTNGFARAVAAAVDDEDNLYVVGWVSGWLIGLEQTGQTDAFIRKYDGKGQELWSRQFGTSAEDRPLGVGVDTAGNPYVVGWTRGLFPRQKGMEARTALERQDAFIRKYDGLGNEVWTLQVGTKLVQTATAVTAAGTGVYVVGQTLGPLLGQVNSGAVDAFLLKLPGGPPRDAAPATSPTLTPNPTIAKETAEPSATQTPVPAATARPSPSPTETPVATLPTGGSCGLSGRSETGIGLLLTILLAPGLLLVRRKRSSP